MQEGYDSGRIITPRKQEPGKFEKFVKNNWNGIKTGIGKAASWLGNTEAGKAGKWILGGINSAYNGTKDWGKNTWLWKNKASILGGIGGLMSGVGKIIDNKI